MKMKSSFLSLAVVATASFLVANVADAARNVGTKGDISLKAPDVTLEAGARDTILPLELTQGRQERVRNAYPNLPFGTKVGPLKLTAEQQARHNARRAGGLAPIDRVDVTYVLGVDGSDTGTANAPSVYSVTTPDGRYTAFTSLASNLTTDETNGVPQVYRYDRQTGTTILVSAAGAGVGGNAGSGMATFLGANHPTWDIWQLGISNDGTRISFTSEADDLVANDNNGEPDVFVWNNGTITRESVDGAGAELAGYSRNGIISGDGTRLVFASNEPISPAVATPRAANLTTATDTAVNRLAGQTQSEDLFWKQVGVPASVTLVSHANGVNTTEANSDSFYASISDDGSRVLYLSRATNLTADALPAFTPVTGAAIALGAHTNVFLWEQASNTNSLVTLTDTGAISTEVGANDDCSRPYISGNGRWATWASGKTLKANIANPAVPGATPNPVNVYVRDLNGPATSLRHVNAAADGLSTRHLGPVWTGYPTIDNTGTRAAYWSYFSEEFNGYDNVPHLWVKVFDSDTSQSGPHTEVKGTAGDHTFTYFQNLGGGGYFGGEFVRPSIAVDGGNLIVTFLSSDPIATGTAADFGTFGVAQVAQATMPLAGFDGIPTDIRLASAHNSSASPEKSSISIGTQTHRFRNNYEGPSLSPSGRYVAWFQKGADAIFGAASLTAFTFLPAGGETVVVADLIGNSFSIGNVSAGTDGLLVGNTTLGNTNLQLIANYYGAVGDFETRGARMHVGFYYCDRIWVDNMTVAVSDNGRVFFKTLDEPYGFFEANPNLNVGGFHYNWMYRDTVADTSNVLLAGGIVNRLAGTADYLNLASYVSPTGQYMAFNTSSSHYVPSFAIGSNNVENGYVWDTASNNVRGVNRRFDGTHPIADTVLTGLSNNGQRTIFNSLTADDIISGGNITEQNQIYMFDELGNGVPNDSVGNTFMVSSNNNGRASHTTLADLNTGFMGFTSLSGDGTKVVFDGELDNLVLNNPASTVAGNQLFYKVVSGSVVAFLDQGPLSVISLKTDNSPLDSATEFLYGNVHISNDGSMASFGAIADDLSAEDNVLGNNDAFFVETADGTITLVSANDDGDQSLRASIWGPKGTRRINGDSFVAFRSDTDNALFPSAHTSVRGIYIKSFLSAPPAESTSWNMYE